MNRKNLLWFLPLLLLWMLPEVVLAGPLSPEALQQFDSRATLKHYPRANTVLLFDQESYRYEPDGLARYSDSSYTKILTEAGRRSLRNLSFSFNAKYGKTVIREAEIIRNGKSIPLNPEKNARTVIDSDGMDSNIYDPDDLAVILPVPDLQIGDVLYCAVEKERSLTPTPGIWGTIVGLQGDDPILYNSVEINAPKSLPLRKIALKNKVKNKVSFSQTEKEDRILYRWEAKDVPAIEPEPDMPKAWTVSQRLLVSTAENWPEISRWYAKLCGAPLNAVSEEMRAKVKELAPARAKAADKAAAIFRFVSQQIHYTGITAEQKAPGYEPHPVKDTFAQRHGVCRDKAALLAAMLRLAGIRAWPALIMAGEPKDDEVPNCFFNHAVVWAEVVPGQPVVMDPTDEGTRDWMPAYLSNCSILPAMPEGSPLLRTPVPPAANNRLVITSTASISAEDDMLVKSDLTFFGVQDGAYRGFFAECAPRLWEQTLSRWLKRAIPTAELKRFSVSPKELRDTASPLAIQLEYRIPKVLTPGGGIRHLALPELAKGFGVSGERFFVLEKRHFPLKLKFTSAVEEHFAIRLPRRLELLAMPAPENREVKGICSFRRELQYRNSVLSGSSRLSFDALEIPPEQYPDVRRLQGVRANAQDSFPAVRFGGDIPVKELIKEFPGADSYLISSITEIDLLSPSSWEKTERTSRIILNHAGVKNFSEVKLPYLPATESVEIQAVVTTADGTPRPLSEESIRIMDAPWRAEAPRYPEAKILVAALPGVEPGGRIDLTVRTKITQAPFFFEGALLASFAPSGKRTVILRAPKHIPLAISPVPQGVQYQERLLRDLRLVRTWTSIANSAIPEERYQAPLWGFAPALLFSAGKYETYCAALDKALRDAVAKRSPLIRETVQKILASVPEKPEDKVRAIRDFVAKNVRLAGPDFDVLPWSSFSVPQETLQAGYGNSADRAILLAALLAEAGFKSDFCVVSTHCFTPKIVQLYKRFPAFAFESVLVRPVEFPAYLNDTGEYAELKTVAAEGRLALDLEKRLPVAIHPSGLYQTKTNVECTAIPRGTNAELRVRMEFRGTDHERMAKRFALMTPRERRIYLDKIVFAISPKASLLRESTDFSVYPGVLKLQIACPDFYRALGTYTEISLPLFSWFLNQLHLAGETRKTPLWVNEGSKLNIDYLLELPEKLTPADSLPENRSWGRSGLARFSENFKVSPREVAISCQLSVAPGIVKPEDYPELVELYRRLGELSSRQLLFTRSAKQGERPPESTSKEE